MLPVVGGEHALDLFFRIRSHNRDSFVKRGLLSIGIITYEAEESECITFVDYFPHPKISASNELE